MLIYHVMGTAFLFLLEDGWIPITSNLEYPCFVKVFTAGLIQCRIFSVIGLIFIEYEFILYIYFCMSVYLNLS